MRSQLVANLMELPCSQKGLKHGYQPTRGFILLTTLMMISILSLLLLSQLKEVLLYTKMVSRQLKQHQELYQLEARGLKLISKNIKDIPRECIREMDSANEVFKILKKTEACQMRVGEARYAYFIENLGDYPCLMIKHKAQLQGSHHWRFTLVHFQEAHGGPALQLRVIKPLKMNQPCTITTKIINSGLSNWRYLPWVSTL